MGGGDLNLKKSWHTGLLSNQRKVWEAEQSALAERKKIEQVRRERDEERQIEELARLAEANGGPKRTARVDWLYGGTASGVMGTTEEQESYLLGKRRVDTLLKKDDALQQKQTQEKAAAVQADPVRDMASKVALDPLLMIERQRQEAMDKAAAVEAKAREREMRRSKSHRERRDRESGSSSRRHRDERDRDREHRSGDRDREKRDGRDRDRRDRDREGHRRRRSHSRSRRESRSPKRRRSRSPASGSSGRDERRYRDRSRSLERSKSFDDRHRSNTADRSNYSSRNSQRPTSHHDRQGVRRSSPHRQAIGASAEKTKEEIVAERQAKLAAMQADASSLEDDRARRLAEMQSRDAAEQEAENRKRNRGGNNFKSQMYQQTESVGLAGRIKGNTRNMMST